MEQIEQATADDIPQLAELLAMLFTQEADFRPDREKQMRGLRLIVDAPDRGRVFLARIDGQIVGMVSLLFTVSTAEGAAACWLEDLVVRRMGGATVWGHGCSSTQWPMPRQTALPGLRCSPTGSMKRRFGSTNGTGFGGRK